MFAGKAKTAPRMHLANAGSAVTIVFTMFAGRRGYARCWLGSSELAA